MNLQYWIELFGLQQIIIYGVFVVVIVWLLYRVYRHHTKVTQRFDRIKNDIRVVFEQQLIRIGEEQYRRVDGEILLTNQYLYEKIDFDTLEEYPPVFTGIGIFGTFLGVVLGLFTFSNQVSSGSSIDAMQVIISDMVSAIGFSFVTSLLGLFCSLFITAMIGRIRTKIDVWRDEQVQKYNTTYKLFCVEDLVMQMLDKTEILTKNSTNQLTEFRLLSDTVGDAIESALMGRNGREGIVPLLQSMIQKQDQIGESFQNSLDQALHSISSSQTQGVGDIVNQFMSEMSSSFGKNFSMLGDSMTQMIASTSSYQKSMETMVHQLQKTTQQQHGAATQVQQAASATAQTLQQVEHVVTGVANTIDNLSSVNAQLIQNIDVQQAFNRSLIDKFEVSKEAWLNQQQDIQNLSKNLILGLQGVHKTIQALQGWHNAIHKELSANVEGWQQGLVMQKEANLQVHQNQELGIQATHNLTLVLKQLDPISAVLETNTKILTQLMQSMTDNISGMSGIGTTLKQEHAQALQKWGLVQAQLDSSSQALRIGIRDFSEHVNTFTVRNLNDWNATLESAISSLSKGINGLHDITETLQDIFETLSPTKGTHVKK